MPTNTFSGNKQPKKEHNSLSLLSQIRLSSESLHLHKSFLHSHATSIIDNHLYVSPLSALSSYLQLLSLRLSLTGQSIFLLSFELILLNFTLY